MIVIAKCKVAAGKTQYTGDSDFNDMKDSFTASGTMSDVPDNLNTIDSIDVNIVSADGNSIYFETNDFNSVRDVKKNIYTHKYKIDKNNSTEGAITSMTINFTKKTFALTVSRADLTGLACPLQLTISLGDFVLTGNVDEAIVNGPKTPIPIQLMTGVKDVLRVDKCTVKQGLIPNTDQLLVSGAFAVEDPGVSMASRISAGLVITLDTKTFTIPAGLKAGTGKFSCTKAVVTEDGSIATAMFNFNTCSFTLTIKNTDIATGLGDVDFGVSFTGFDETDEVSLP